MKTALGHALVAQADDQVDKLNQVKVGDSVAVAYYESLAVSNRTARGSS